MTTFALKTSPSLLCREQIVGRSDKSGCWKTTQEADATVSGDGTGLKLRKEKHLKERVVKSVMCKGVSKGSTGLRTGHNVSKEEKQMSFAFAFLGLKRRAWFIHSDSEKRALLVCKNIIQPSHPQPFHPGELWAQETPICITAKQKQKQTSNGRNKTSNAETHRPFQFFFKFY